MTRFLRQGKQDKLHCYFQIWFIQYLCAYEFFFLWSNNKVIKVKDIENVGLIKFEKS